MKISEMMTRAVVSCRPEENLMAAAQRMWDSDCGAVPVVDENERLVGMITDRDAFMGAWMHGGSLESTHIGDVMARDVVSCRPGDDVDRAEQMMAERRVRRIPIVDDERRVVGILSLNDIVLAACTSHPKGVASLTPQRVAATLAAISTPHTQASAGAEAE